MVEYGPQGEVGPRVGERFPEICLPDQDGKAYDLHQRKGDRRALIIFHRSALW